MANFKRGKTKRCVRCTMCTQNRWKGNSKDRWKVKDQVKGKINGRLQTEA